MYKKVFVSLLVLFALALASCAPAAAPVEEAPAAEEPAAPAEEAPAEEAPAEEAPACTPKECVDFAIEAKPVAEVQAACEADDFGCAVINPGQTIKIGMGSPMTGGDASFGIDAENSGKLAVADACTVAGFQFELVAEDDGGAAEGGAAVANKFAADPTVVGVGGHLFSGASFAAMPIYEEAGIPMMSPSATNPGLTRQGSRVFNRIPFTDEKQGAEAAAYMYNVLGFRKVAFLHDSQDYGKGLAEIAAKAFEELGGEVVELMGVTTKEPDYSPVLTTIAAKNPDAVYFGGYTQDGGVITNNMKTTGLENAVFFGCDGTYGKDYLDRTGANGEGSYHATPRTPPETPEKSRFDACFIEAYGVGPGELSPFSWNSYDVTTILTEKVKEVAMLGDDGSLYIPRGALVDAVRNLTDWTGISGTYTCDDTGECNVEGPQFWVVKDGKFEPVN